MISQRRLFYAICVGYVLLAVTYSVVTPLFEASDELWHYPMVKYLADNSLSLPQPDPAQPWRQEGGQPPLYYMLAAVLTGGIDTSDMEFIRRINPHADIGVVRPDGNANMMVHRPGAESFPWAGTVLAVQVIRTFSVLLGLGTVIVTYALAREIFPDWEIVALGAAALTAFLPMFLFISGSVNNDNLSNLLGNLLTLLIVRLLKVTERPGWRTYAVIGIVTGAGILSKLNIGFLIPLVALALLIVAVRFNDWRHFVVGGAISGGLTILIAGWWYWRNWQLYGDPTGLNAFLDTVGRRLVPANLTQLWAERHSFTQAYWGFFGGMNVPLTDVVYLVFNIVGGLSLVSAVIFLVYWVPRRNRPFAMLPAAVTVIWSLVTFISFLRWTAETPASQGRLIFGALSSISLWMAVGLVWWLPRRWQALTLTPIASYYIVVAVAAPFLVIAPMYAPPTAVEPGPAEITFAPPARADENGLVNLLGAEVTSQQVEPEAYVLLDTSWQVVEPLSRDWSLFVHLTTPDNVIVSQRDVYPGQGRLATSDLSAGFAWTNPIAVRVPVAVYTPTTLNVDVGWYHLPTGERLTLPDGDETYTIGQVALVPHESNLDVPNPVSINFDNQIELVGYEYSTLTPAVGETMTVTLYWRALRPIRDNYTAFVHVIDPRSFTIYAGSDAQPAGGAAPTAGWQVGDIITDTHTMTVRGETPPDIYEVELGWYLPQADGSFPRLRIVTRDGGMADNFIYLSRVRVLPAEVD